MPLAKNKKQLQQAIIEKFAHSAKSLYSEATAPPLHKKSNY